MPCPCRPPAGLTRISPSTSSYLRPSFGSRRRSWSVIPGRVVATRSVYAYTLVRTIGGWAIWGPLLASNRQVVVHGDLELLLPPQVALGRLDGGVPQKKLNLLEGASGEPTEFRAGPPEVVG